MIYRRVAPSFLRNRPRSVLLAVLAFASAGGAATVSFESREGFAAGADATVLQGWKASAPGLAKISSAEAQSGSQSLEIAASGTGGALERDFSVPADGVVFIDFAILPTVDISETPLSTVDVNGAILGFVKWKDGGGIVALTRIAANDQTSNSVDTGYRFPIDERNAADEWIRVTIRENLKARKWDLFVNGKLTLIDQPLVGKSGFNPAALTFYASPAGASFVDILSISGDNPLFADADKDGIPDAMEKATGSNFQTDDRNTQVPGRTSSSIQIFFAERAGASKVSGRRVIYVDNGSGSDVQTGEFSYKVGNQGPKASLKAATEDADADTTIALISSGIPYSYSSSRHAQKTLNLLPIGSVILENTK